MLREQCLRAKKSVVVQQYFIDLHLHHERTGGSKWVQAQPAGSKWGRALPGQKGGLSNVLPA